MATLRLVEPPTAAGVTLAEAKAHLNVDFDDDDDLIVAYVEAAIERLSYLNRALRFSRWALDLASFVDEIILPRPPLVEVESVTFLDAADVGQTLSTSVYEVKTDCLGQGVLRLKSGQGWPSLSNAREPVTISFAAGYVTLPGPLKAAVLLTVGALYDHRAEVSGAQVFALPFGVDALVSTYRIWTPSPAL
jgi:uncharacterized phiE125 gp8 family phage protein